MPSQSNAPRRQRQGWPGWYTTATRHVASRRASRAAGHALRGARRAPGVVAVTPLRRALSGREVVLALAGFLGLVAIVASLVAGSILRSHPAPPAPTAPQDSPPA